MFGLFPVSHFKLIQLKFQIGPSPQNSVAFDQPIQSHVPAASKKSQVYYATMGVFIALALVLLALYLAYRWSIASYEYFKLRGVPFVKPLPLVGGMFPVLSGTVFIVDCISEGYRQFRASRFSGLFMFRQPAYLIHDPELIKKIAIADFEHFVDHSFKFSTKMDPFLGRSLFFMDGLRWRQGRSGLSPAFTGSKMRSMFGLLTSYCEGAMERLANSGGVREMELNDLFKR